MATIRPAASSDVPALIRLAARTFPLACPPDARPEAVAAHVATTFTTDLVHTWLLDPSHRILVADNDAMLCGYAMVVRGVPGDHSVASAVGSAVKLELSKIYVDSDQQGTGIADLLMAGVLEAGANLVPGSAICLGTNGVNLRAQAFYRRHGFEQVGTRT